MLEPLAEYNQLLGLEKEIDEKIIQYKEAIGGILRQIRSWRWNDSVSEIYRELFGPQIIIEQPLTHDEIETDLKRRIANRIPPGFKDSSKDDQGIGDLLIWQSILHLGRERKRSIIFVSGDEKTDWWHRSENEALYPRVELVDEYSRVSDGKSFHIAKFSQLLDLFGAEEQLVEEVRKKEQVLNVAVSGEYFYWRYERAEIAVGAWLNNRFPEATVIRNLSTFPDFFVKLLDGTTLGVEVKLLRTATSLLFHRFREVAFRGYYEVNEGRLDDFWVVFVAKDDATASGANVSRAVAENPKVGMVIGYLDSSGEFVLTIERPSSF